jgi:hypothetical protein
MEMELTRFIIGLIYIYCKTPKEINKGDCLNFAQDILLAFPTAEIHIDGEPAIDKISFHHAYIMFEGKYYDSETSDGVEDWRELPFYSRADSVLFPFEKQKLGLK